MSVFDSLKHKIEGGFKSLGHKIESELKHAGHEIEGDLRKLESEAQVGLKKLNTELQHDLKQVGASLEKELSSVMDQITGAVVRDAIHRTLSVLQSPYAPSNFEIEIGPLTLDFSDLGDRVADVILVLEEHVSHVPVSREDIIKFVVALSPTTVTLGIGISLAFLFVESEDLSVAVRLSWSGEDITADMLTRVMSVLD